MTSCKRDFPVIRTTEIVMEDMADLKHRGERVWDYDPDLAISANLTNPTVRALEDSLSVAEKGEWTVAVQTGQAAITTAIMGTLQAGQKLLLPDNAYGPVKMLAENQLKPLGIMTDYYDPQDIGDLEARVTPETGLIYLESPASLTFEVQDIAAIAKIAQDRGVTTAIDNTYATPAGCNPLEYGIDLVIHSLSKLVSGNSDVFAGSVTGQSEEHYKKIKNMAVFMGHWLSPDDAARVHEGMQTLEERLQMQQAVAADVIAYLSERPEVAAINAPYLESSPTKDLWDQYYTQACGLFSFAFQEDTTEQQVSTFMDSLQHFRLSFGWGGIHSLAVPSSPSRNLAEAPKNLVRIFCSHTANSEELIMDLEQAFGNVMPEPI